MRVQVGSAARPWLDPALPPGKNAKVCKMPEAHTPQ
jgi:hypothetical protein